MAVRPPSAAEIQAIAVELGLSLEPDEVAAYRELTSPLLAGLSLLDAAPDGRPLPRAPRTPGARPPEAENPLGAWAVKTRIQGAREGPLAGRSVVLKDNVMLAGVPLSNGSALHEGYVPSVDATVVTRLLDAGAVIVGKAVCEAFCLSAGSHTSESGPVRNPHDPRRSAGGSSSGSAALVAAGEVELAIGGDQAGSIRIPASFCGCVGMKPTHGLVPYTGVLSLEPTLDHVGPITARVEDNARMLQVLAGADGWDSRQGQARTDDYVAALDRGAEGLKVGLLREGFGGPGAEADVEDCVRQAAARLAEQGCELREVSVPLHRTAAAWLLPIYQSAFVNGLYADGCVLGREELMSPDWLDRSRLWRQRPDDLPASVKVLLFATEVLRRRYGFRYYAKAVNAVRRVREAYDAALREVDLLLLPTTPMKAPLLPGPQASLRESVQASFAPPVNTLIFDHTHHPALSVPCGRSQGLPVGLMLVGRAWQEAVLYRVAASVERAAG